MPINNVCGTEILEKGRVRRGGGGDDGGETGQTRQLNNWGKHMSIGSSRVRTQRLKALTILAEVR